MRVARDEQQRLLPTHAAADGVDPARVDVQPRELSPQDRRHPRQVVDLPAPAPGVPRQHAALPLRADDGERPERRQAAPEAEVGAGLDPASVW